MAKQEVAVNKKNSPEAFSKLAVVLVRGLVGISVPVRDTLKMLRLDRKNHCVIVDNTPAMRGMIQKVKDYVTWGEITPEVFTELITRRGEEWNISLMDRKEKYSYKTLEWQGKNYKPYFRLNPPQKGFGRKGIKISFKAGGALGYRGDKINDLLQRML